ncbi:MAG: UPF0158 family protein [Methanomassiliicoccaceae archaeon]|nr:UPF0158 family protein [Methanomassiliicoccaceae archaeon]
MKKLDLKVAADMFDMIRHDQHIFYNKETGELDYYSEFADPEYDDSEKFEDSCWVAGPDAYELDVFSLMDRFADGLTDARAKELLILALDGKGAFRRFRTVLEREGLEEEWYAFKHDAFIEIAREWCKDNDIPYEEAS